MYLLKHNYIWPWVASHTLLAQNEQNLLASLQDLIPIASSAVGLLKLRVGLVDVLKMCFIHT